MDNRIIESLSSLLTANKPSNSTEFDKTIGDWWDRLSEDERYEVINELTVSTEIHETLLRCGCSVGTQRCGVKY